MDIPYFRLGLLFLQIAFFKFITSCIWANCTNQTVQICTNLQRLFYFKKVLSFCEKM